LCRRASACILRPRINIFSKQARNTSTSVPSLLIHFFSEYGTDSEGLPAPRAPVKFIPQKWDEDVDDNEEDDDDDEPNHAKPIMGDLRFDLHP